MIFPLSSTKPSRGIGQRAVALVTTVIMLSVITMMAVAFLSITRRERASVTSFNDASVAKQMAAMGRERAITETVSRFYAMSNMFAYDFMVATNYLHPNGFNPGGIGNLGSTNQTANVTSPELLSGNAALDNLLNMRFDPRVPVVLPDENNSNEFRFFLDLNRNRAFEPTGLIPRNFQNLDDIVDVVGDPQWIGVLENPDLPHSSSNLFIGRYTFVALPTGKSLDVNYIHNQGKRPANPLLDGFFRGQGAASWELNLAGFLNRLDRRYWKYDYEPDTTFSSFGGAFEMANRILRYRYGGSGYVGLPTLASEFPPGLAPSAPVVFQTFLEDGVDLFADGALEVNERANLPWPGAQNPNRFFDLQEFFTRGRAYSEPENRTDHSLIDVMTDRMTNSPVVPFDTDDRYLYYDLLSQMGMDSVPANRNKLNLNWDNRGELDRHVTEDLAGRLPQDPEAIYPETIDTLHWAPRDLFMEMADRMLRQVYGFGVTNIPVYPVNAYNASVHRILQVAANIADANFHGSRPGDPAGYSRRAVTTGAGDDDDTAFVFPMVFKPVLGSINATNIFIKGYEMLEAGGGAVVRQGQWFDLTDTNNVPVLGAAVANINRRSDNINVYGLPYVLSAREGIPQFNEAKMETEVSVARKVEVSRRSVFEPFSAPKRIRQFHLLSVANEVGLEAWNPYEDRIPDRNMTIYATNQVSLTISNFFNNGAAPSILARFNPVPISTAESVTGAGSWPGSVAGAVNSFKVPVDERITHLDGAMFASGQLFNTTNLAETLPWDQELTIPEWVLYVTNRFQYLLTDDETDWILDFVNIDGVRNEYNISATLRGDIQASGAANPANASSVSSLGRFWDNTVQDFDLVSANIPAGIRDQFLASLGELNVPWNSANGDPVGGQDKQKRIEEFRQFVGLQAPSPSVATLTRKQLPYPVSRAMRWKTTLQANDPFVHYTWEDLLATTNSLPTDIPIVDDSNLGRINERYRPWGGNPNMDPAGDINAVNPAIKDAGVRSSVDWNFPNLSVTLANSGDYTGEKFATLGDLGAIHRGTPWQTFYLKSSGVGDDFVDLPRWSEWSGHRLAPQFSHPTNDWRMLSLFTTAVNDSAARGLLSVNQTNSAAWAAVLAGVAVPDPVDSTAVQFIDPREPEFDLMVEGINAARARNFNEIPTGFGGHFPYMGAVLSANELSLTSPWALASSQPTDAIYEAVPRSILNLVQDDVPRITVFAYGQALRPAQNSVVGRADRYNGVVTNYVPTSEFVTKSLVEFEASFPTPQGAVRRSFENFSPTNDWVIPTTLDYDVIQIAQ